MLEIIQHALYVRMYVALLIAHIWQALRQTFGKCQGWGSRFNHLPEIMKGVSGRGEDWILVIRNTAWTYHSGALPPTQGPLQPSHRQGPLHQHTEISILRSHWTIHVLIFVTHSCVCMCTCVYLCASVCGRVFMGMCGEIKLSSSYTNIYKLNYHISPVAQLLRLLKKCEGALGEVHAVQSRRKNWYPSGSKKLEKSYWRRGKGLWACLRISYVSFQMFLQHFRVN